MIPNITCQADVDADIQQLITQDPRLTVIFNELLAAGVSIPLRLREGGFAGLAQIVVGQLLSVASACAIYKRLEQLVSPLNAQNYLQTQRQRLLDCGLSQSKYLTLQAIANAQQSGQFSFQQLTALDGSSALKILCEFKGVGPWTAEVYLLFCLGHRDIFPAADLALQKAVAVALQLNITPNAKDLRGIARQWSPYRSAAARLFWAYYGQLKGRAGVFSV